MDFGYFVQNCRLTAIDLSNQTKLKDRQQVSFIGKFENQAFGATMFFIIEKSEQTTFNFTKFCIKMEIQNIVNLLNSSENEYSKCVMQKSYVIDSETKGLYFSYRRYCCHKNYW